MLIIKMFVFDQSELSAQPFQNLTIITSLEYGIYYRWVLIKYSNVLVNMAHNQNAVLGFGNYIL